MLSLEGNENQIEQAVSLIKFIKVEPQLTRPPGRINPPAAEFNCDASAQFKTQTWL